MNQKDFIPSIVNAFNLSGFRLVDFEIHSSLYANPTRDYYIFEVFFMPLESMDGGQIMRARFMEATLEELLEAVKKMLKTLNMPPQPDTILKIMN